MTDEARVPIKHRSVFQCPRCGYFYSPILDAIVDAWGWDEALSHLPKDEYGSPDLRCQRPGNSCSGRWTIRFDRPSERRLSPANRSLTFSNTGHYC